MQNPGPKSKGDLCDGAQKRWCRLARSSPSLPLAQLAHVQSVCTSCASKNFTRGVQISPGMLQDPQGCCIFTRDATISPGVLQFTRDATIPPGMLQSHHEGCCKLTRDAKASPTFLRSPPLQKPMPVSEQPPEKYRRTLNKISNIRTISRLHLRCNLFLLLLQRLQQILNASIGSQKSVAYSLAY